MQEIKNKTTYEVLNKLLEDNNLVLLSGASASGKSYILEKVIQNNPNVVKLKSITTRNRRNEFDNDYRFVSKKEFDKLNCIKKVEFPEGSGHWYGYEIDELKQKLNSGHKVVIILAPSVIKFYKEFFTENKIPFVSTYWYVNKEIFIKRYLNREGYDRVEDLPHEDKHQMEERIREMQEDVKLWKEYDYVVDGSKKFGEQKRSM